MTDFDDIFRVVRLEAELAAERKAHEATHDELAAERKAHEATRDELTAERAEHEATRIENEQLRGRDEEHCLEIARLSGFGPDDTDDLLDLRDPQVSVMRRRPRS